MRNYRKALKGEHNRQLSHQNPVGQLSTPIQSVWDETCPEPTSLHEKLCRSVKDLIEDNRLHHKSYIFIDFLSLR